MSQLPRVATYCHTYMYADDTQLLLTFHPGDAVMAATQIEDDLAKIHDWSTSHGLCLNPSKSSTLLAGSTPLLQSVNSFSLKINNIPVLVLSSVKILGVTFDSSWKFTHHVSAKISTAWLRLKLLYPLRKILPRCQKLLVSQLLVLSLFDYADVVYCPCLTKAALARIQSVQNSCLRFSFLARKYDHVTPLIKDSGWLVMKQRWILHLCCLVYKIIRDDTPPYLRELIKRNSDFYTADNCIARSESLLAVPMHRTCKYCGSFSYAASRYYNLLPPSIC